MNTKWLVAGTGIACSMAATTALPADDEDDDEEIPFDVAEIFFELNDTDGDLGFHGTVDGDAWKWLKIENRDERLEMKVQARGGLRQQGLTELFFESAEPPFDELSPDEIFERFPPGKYEIEARTLEGEELESETRVTHRMPAPAEPTVNDTPMAMQCDDEEPGYDAPTVSGEVVIKWPPVTRTHPTIGRPKNSTNIAIVNYEVVVETELEEFTGPEGAFEVIFSVILPPNATEMTVPAQVLALSDTFKYEILARERSFNQTAVESCFLYE